jgi:hypothetical protein
MKELGPDIRGARWRMFGHTLRMTDDTQAKRVMLHYFDVTVWYFEVEFQIEVLQKRFFRNQRY